MEVKTIVFRAEGTTGIKETVTAFKKAGSKVDLVHINELKRREKPLEDYQILCIAGSSAYGDYVSAGKILAVKLKHILGNDIKKFIDELGRLDVKGKHAAVFDTYMAKDY